MNIRYRKQKKTSKLKEILVNHIGQNIKEYTIITLIFIIGIIIGVIFINNTSENQSNEITNYINTFMGDLKSNSDINSLLLLKDSLSKNITLAIFLWFMGSTVIGISIVYITICFRGFCLGYTISSIILTFGMRKRNIIFKFNSATTKHFIYTMHNSPRC